MEWCQQCKRLCSNIDNNLDVGEDDDLDKLMRYHRSKQLRQQKLEMSHNIADNCKLIWEAQSAIPIHTVLIKRGMVGEALPTPFLMAVWGVEFEAAVVGGTLQIVSIKYLKQIPILICLLFSDHPECSASRLQLKKKMNK
ncbi:unnamed protein product [Ceutorhynchus assimilis]|uniref:Uncharacterized protein n=1 Tax=Ceutorhynchus assimilis TaxID=467358 RepID=A0A9N9ME71_9CUCU|nr:unnamed protein product [Ceutorhynchus assimilis]